MLKLILSLGIAGGVIALAIGAAERPGSARPQTWLCSASCKPVGSRTVAFTELPLLHEGRGASVDDAYNDLIHTCQEKYQDHSGTLTSVSVITERDPQTQRVVERKVVTLIGKAQACTKL